MKTYKTTMGIEVKRVSRWIQIQCAGVTEKHSLHGYSSDGELLFFNHDRRKYALGQFLRFDFGPKSKVVYYEGNGEKGILSGYDSTEYYYPLMIEIDPKGEAVRLYQEVEK